MRHFKVFVVAVVSAFVALAFATEKPAIVPSKTQAVQIAPIKINKETRVSITGIVKELSDRSIVVERSVKDNMEAMEFILEKPVESIRIGDKVKISYVKKAGKNIARKVAPVTIKRISKKTPPANEVKSLPVETATPKK